LLDPFVPAGHVMDQHHAGPRPAAERARVIGLADVALVAAKSDGLRKHAFVRHAVTRWIVIPWRCCRHDYTCRPPARSRKKGAPPERGGLAKKRPLSRDTCGARPCRSGPDPRNRWSCRHAA